MTVSAWLSAVAKNSKSDDPNGHRFCDKKSVTQKVSKTPCAAQLPFSSLFDLFRILPCFGLCFAWFVGLLTHLFRLRVSSPLAISRLTANALLQPSLRAMTAHPMTGFHRTQGIPRMENNTLELQLLSEFCHVLAISNVQTAILR